MSLGVWAALGRLGPLEKKLIASGAGRVTAQQELEGVCRFVPLGNMGIEEAMPSNTGRSA
jgi:hypothetical protein